MQQVILIGDPVAHSRSPAMHNAAFAALGLPLQYIAVHTPASQVAERVQSLRGAGYLGANVTLPHKEAVLPFLDELEPEAAAIGAVNTIYKRADGALIGANTDAPGLIADLQAADVNPEQQHAVLLGASGAARAAAFALASAGVAELIIANRNQERAARLIAELQPLAKGLAAQPRLRALALDDPALSEALAQTNLLINATSLGWQADETPLPQPQVNPHCLVYDMVYHETRLLREAALLGARTRHGAGMLIHQGALAFTRWTQQAAPLELMWEAFSSAGQKR